MTVKFRFPEAPVRSPASGGVSGRPVPQTAETAAASAARDDLIDQRETARAYTASSLGNGTPLGSHQPATSGSRWNRLHLSAPQAPQPCARYWKATPRSHSSDQAISRRR